MENTTKLKRVIYISASALLIGIIIFISRGPHISNALKKVILPELENMTGRKVIAQKIYINLLPLFIEVKGVKVFDDEGNRVMTAERLKGYLSMVGILRRIIVLKRVIIIEPEALTNKEQFKDISEKVKAYLAADRNKIKVRANVIEIRDGEISFYDSERGSVTTGRKLNAEFLLGDITRLKVHIKEMVANIENFPELSGEVKGTLFFNKEGIEIKDITLNSHGSKIQASGSYSQDGKGRLKTDTVLFADSVKEAFGLKQKEDGKIYAKGNIKFGEGSPLVDLKLDGSFYLQTLMELLKVKERVEGLVDFDGRISGTLASLTGSADARLRKGNLFDVDIDELKCEISYGNGVLSFKNGKALLYNGRADAEASIKLPNVEHYSVKVNFTDVDSSAALKLINLNIDLPKGKVKGELYTSDSEFNPAGWFDYRAPRLKPSLAKGEPMAGDVFGRLRSAKGIFKVQGDTLSLTNTEVRTEKSALGLSGTIAMKASALNLNGRLETGDITDLASPYFKRLKGSGDFTGAITGKFDDPLLSGALKINSASFDGYQFESISGVLSYKKNLLDIKELSAKSKDEQHIVRGHIKFNEAKKAFDFKQPGYNLSVSLKGADIEKLVNIFYPKGHADKKLQVKGRLNADFKITGSGSNPVHAGSLFVYNAEAYKLPVDSVSADFSYNHNDLIIKRALLEKGASALIIEGRITGAEKFSFSASASRIFLKDMGLQGMPDDSMFSVNAYGSGAFDNPSISLKGKLSGGTFKGKPLGSGVVSASVKNKNILVDAVMFNGKMKVKGKGYMSDELPWNAEVDMAAGRYDFLLVGVLKDVPEDLLLNMRGHAVLSGTKKRFSASALIEQLTLALFGHSFSSDSSIKIKFDDRNMSFSPFTMRSGNASFSMHGNVDIGEEYNIALRGSSALAPLKGFSKNISVLRGDSDFALTIAGKWDNPRINGSFNVANATFGLRDMHQRISDINGQLYFEGDRVVFQKLSGKLSGGDINVSGRINLQGFAIKRFYLDANMNDITTSISRDFTVNFSGNVLYKGTLDSQNITGEVKINRARYRERVEWKSWLLKVRAKEKPKGELTKVDKAVLNVKIYGTENIVVDNNIARAPLKADIILRGTVGHPLLFGRLESREGKVYFRNIEFRILHASADFADPNRINPIIEIVAQTTVKGYNIKMHLDGQLEHFNLSLVSDPPLDETDILSLLTVGQRSKELRGLEGGIGAGEAASFLTGKVQDVFEERLRNITGLDRIQVDPYVSKSTGTVGPRVTASKKLLGDKLFVTYVSPVGSTEEQVLKLEYLLEKNISLVGVKDERGSVGGDIKFRFEFK